MPPPFLLSVYTGSSHLSLCETHACVLENGCGGNVLVFHVGIATGPFDELRSFDISKAISFPREIAEENKTSESNTRLN